jgi:hypothetical protein
LRGRKTNCSEVNMDASKESCRKAKLAFQDLMGKMTDTSTSEGDDARNKAWVKTIEDFFDTAEKKLPMQSSIDRDRASKRRKAGRVVPELLDGVPEGKRKPTGKVSPGLSIPESGRYPT